MKYFIKHRGKAFGPFEEEKILQMYNDDRFDGAVEISRDKKTWESIETIIPKPEPEPPQISLQQRLNAFEPPEIPVQTDDNSGAIPSDSPPPIPDNLNVWYYTLDGVRGRGPISKFQLEMMLCTGQINRQTLVWRQGEGTRPIDIEPDLADIVNSGSDTNSQPQQSSGSIFDSNAILSAPNVPQTPSFNFPNVSRSVRPSGFAPSTQSRKPSNPESLADFNFDDIDSFEQQRNTANSETDSIDRNVFVLLAIFFGTLGVHNFYANRMETGVVQLFIGLTNLATFIIVFFITLFSQEPSYGLFLIPVIIGTGLEIWAITEIFLTR